MVLLSKCDTIGSLEAIVEMLRRSQVPIAKADIGPVNRRDIMAGKSNQRERQTPWSSFGI